MNTTILKTLKQFSVLALLAASLCAQSGRRVVARVPFNFTVQNQHFASGSYDITTDFGQGVVLIRSDDGGSGMFVLTHGGKSAKPESNAKLVFNRYGDTYFLSEVWPAGSDHAQELPRSKAEQELARATKKAEPVSLLAGARPARPDH